MGVLANLVPSTAAGAADASMRYGALGTGLGMAGSVVQGIGGLQQGLFAARIAKQNALAALRAGQSAESMSKMKYGALEAEQKAAQAANGVQVDSGSPAAVRASTAALSNIDAAMIHYNAAREAFGERVQGELDKKAGVNALIGGVLGAGNDFLSGASSLSDKWARYRNAGVEGYT